MTLHGGRVAAFILHHADNSRRQTTGLDGGTDSNSTELPLNWVNSLKTSKYNLCYTDSAKNQKLFYLQQSHPQMSWKLWWSPEEIWWVRQGSERQYLNVLDLITAIRWKGSQQKLTLWNGTLWQTAVTLMTKNKWLETDWVMVYVMHLFQKESRWSQIWPSNERRN